MEENKTAARGEDIIAGRNAITEALKAGRTIDSIYVARGNRTGSIGGIIAKAKQSGIPIKDADPKKLDYLCGHANHQGVVAVAAVKEYASLEDLFRVAEERGEPPFFLIADELEDPPQSGGDPAYGGMLRSARCDCAAPPRRGPYVCRGQGVGRSSGICAGSTGDQSAEHTGGTEKTRRLDLRRRYGRSGLVRCGLPRPRRDRHRLGGLRSQPADQRKIGFYHIFADAGKDKLVECFCGMRRDLL